MICFMVGAPMAVLGTILTAADKVWTVSFVALSGCILNIVCNVLFIPSYGALGASWTTLATALFITLMYLWHLRSFIGQLLSWKVSIQYVALGIMCWACFALINQLLPIEFLFKVILYLIITCAIIASTKWLQISILPTTRN